MAIPEGFDTITLHYEELHEALLQVKIPAEVNIKFSSELRHIVRSMGVPILFLPVHSIEEAKFFSTLVLEMTVFDENAMVIEWCNHANGTAIFPKLHVYLRLHFAKWGNNKCVQDAVKNVVSGTALLEEVNNFHTIPVQGHMSIHTAIQGTVQGAMAVSTNRTEQVHVRTADPYSAQQIVAQAMTPNIGTEHSQNQESPVQYVLEASAAVDETSVIATNIETASTENSMTRADMLTIAGNGALQDISSPQTFNMKRHDQELYGGWCCIQRPRSAFRPEMQCILTHKIQRVAYINY
jgi:hypothetical protein